MNEQEAQAAALDVYLEREAYAPPETGDGVVIYRAAPGTYLRPLGEVTNIRCIQTDKPLAEELSRLGYMKDEVPDNPVRLAIVFATKHREEVLYHLALAAESLVEGGTLILTAANALGAPSLERRTVELMGGVESFSKHKCRVFHAIKYSGQMNLELLQAWKQAGELRRIEATGYFSCPGLFSWKSIDLGSRLLADSLPADLRGCGADLGAGYGYLSRMALERAPGINVLHLFEAERKALDAAKRNLEEFESRCKLHFHWADVTAGPDLTNLDFVLMNPPFHVGRGTLPALGRSFVQVALRLLKPGGRLFMVANRHLPYEGEIQALPAVVESEVQDSGFKLIVVRKM
jgi:16S rRNA (guanine1207-N2)-methyltransferase